MTRHTTYPKISHRGFIDFEILSRFFTFVFSCKKYQESAPARTTNVVE
jgi:hypothetical protein